MNNGQRVPAVALVAMVIGNLLTVVWAGAFLAMIYSGSPPPQRPLSLYVVAAILCLVWIMAWAIVARRRHAAGRSDALWAVLTGSAGAVAITAAIAELASTT